MYLSAVKRCVLSTVVRATGKVIRPLSCSVSPLHQQHHQDSVRPPSLEEARPYSEIPKTKTFLGLNMEMMKSAYHIKDYLRSQRNELGPIFRLTGAPGQSEQLFVFDPKDVETVFRLGDNVYPRRSPLTIWVDARTELNLPMGIFLQEGEKWHKQRAPVSNFILMPRKMAQYHGPFNDVTLDYIDLIRAHRQQDNLFLDTAGSLNKWAIESVSLFVLGKRMGCLGDQMPQECKEFVNDMHGFTSVTQDLLLGVPFHKLWKTGKWKKLVNLMEAVFTFAKHHINQKIKEIEEESTAGDEAELGMDFLTYMIHSGKMTVGDVSMDAVDLILAGVHTTSMTMAGCMYSLATNPDIQEKLRREVQAVVGKEEMVTPQHIQDMHYLRDVIKETMRLFPIILNNSRILPEDAVLSGFRVPAETVIVMSNIVNGTDPKFFPEPDRFKPERWDRGNKDIPSSFLSLPFGYGRRSCIGRRVAELEMHILLSHLIRNFKIEYREKKPMEFDNSMLFYGPSRQLNLAFIDL